MGDQAGGGAEVFRRIGDEEMIRTEEDTAARRRPSWWR